MGMLAAVEMWVKRDHQGRMGAWEAWLDQIATQVKKVDGVTSELAQPREGLSNRTPQLTDSVGRCEVGHHRDRKFTSCCSIRSRASFSPVGSGAQAREYGEQVTWCPT